MTSYGLKRACLEYLRNHGISTMYFTALLEMATENTNSNVPEIIFEEFKRLALLTNDIQVKNEVE